MSTSVSIAERDEAVLKFYPRVFVIAGQIIRKSKVHGDLRILAQHDYEGAGTDGLLRAAQARGNQLTQAYADVSIRNAIIQYQRDSVRSNTPPSKVNYVPYNWDKMESGEPGQPTPEFQTYQFDSRLNRAGIFKNSECDRGVDIVSVNRVNTREVNARNRQRHEQALSSTISQLDGELTRDSDPNLVLYARQQLALSALAKFPEPERSILRMRSSLDGKPKTYQEIADALGLTERQVSYAHKQALEFLRQPRAIASAQTANTRLSADYASLSQEIVVNERRTAGTKIHTLLLRCEHGMYWPADQKIAYACSWCNPNQHHGAQHSDANISLPLSAATHEWSQSERDKKQDERQGSNPQRYTPNYKRISGTQAGGGTQHQGLKVAPPEGNLEPITEKELYWPTHISGTTRKQGFARPCLFKGNRYDHPQYGTGVIQADWTPWGEGIEVLFRDGSLRRIAQTPDAKLPNAPAENTLPETCLRLRIQFSTTCGQKIAAKSPRTQTAKISWKHSDIADWNAIPDNVISSEMYRGFNPFPDGGPSSIGKYAWIRQSDIQPSVDLERKRTEMAEYDSKVFIGPLARPTWQRLNSSFCSSNLAAATRVTLRIIH